MIGLRTRLVTFVLSAGLVSLSGPNVGLADEIFGIEDLEALARALQDSACANGCEDETWAIMPVVPPPGVTLADGERLFHVKFNYESGWCGSRGPPLPRAAISESMARWTAKTCSI